MFKFKNLKILLFLMLFAFAGNDAWAFDTKYYSYHLIDVKPSGAGKVYSTPKTENGANTNFNACVDPPYTQNWHTGYSTNTLYLLAKANEGYVFSHWEDQNGNTVSSSNPGQVTAQCAQTSTTSPGDYNGTYYAVFVPTQAVEVYTENADFGTASISNSQNEIGQTITLTAHENLFQHAFVGWRKESNGQIVSNENPYTFTITEQTQGKYYAVFRDDYYFYRIKNYGTGRYMVATNDQGGITNLSSFSLITGLENVIYDAGSIVQVRIHYAETTAHTREYAIIVQGEDTQEITGAYLRMDRVEANELTLWEPNADGIRARDNGGANVSLALASSADNTKWIFEKLDLDLYGSSYFSLDPDKLVKVDGKYYTTLRTSWNILFNPEQMTPYVVTEVDEVNGTFEMEPITGNIIPAGTPVIIETKSNDVEENRMVPTKTAEASGAVPSGNQLVSSTKYFPNQSVAVANNYKKLMVNANGQLAFGGNALSTVNGNEAYLRVASEVVKIPILPLADIERDGIKDKHYTIADQLIAVDYCHVDGTEDVYLWCKDQKNASIFPTNKNEDQIDFMRQGGNDAPQKGEWDQSNWVVLKLTGPDGLNKAEEAVPTINGQKQKRFIKEKTVTGKYIDDKNFMIEVDNNNFTVEEGEASYTPNVYATTNFLLENLNIWGDERDGGYTSGNPNQNYFFMNPKIQEVCTVTYAVWDGSKFVVPTSSGFTGSIDVAWDYNEPLGVAEALTQVIENSQVEIAYNFLAVVNRTDFGYGPGFEPSKSTSDNPLLVYPLNLDPANENNVITAIDGVQSGKTITRVVYYNLMGVESDKPHPGINIVETRYSDGSRSTVKVVK